MTTISEAAQAFLANKRIAVTGVTQGAKGHGGTAIYKRLQERGYQTFAVNPGEKEIDGNPCYSSLQEIPGGVAAVVIATEPAEVEATIRECAELGIKQVWMHRALGIDSVNAEAVTYGREHGITVIDGGCPLMFGHAADLGHRLVCFMMTRTGKVPRNV